MTVSLTPLHESSLSLDHEALLQTLTSVDNLLVIQDLDGVCMGLVKDPLTRVIDPKYVEATQAFDGHFFVLTNGEHIGKRGINRIIEKAFNPSPQNIRERGFYLPGLAAGGVQWQDRSGNVTHPGVSTEELRFLESIPQRITTCLSNFFEQHKGLLPASQLQECIQASVLDNKVSPTANLNTFYESLGDRADVYLHLQQQLQSLMETLLQEAEQQGLGHSFFVHYAPNLGRDAQGKEIMRPVQGQDSGTTDFQFMVQGAIKEAGVLVILNHYYYRRTGAYPLGADFSVRQAPKELYQLLDIVKTHFDPEGMPLIIGVGDTVTSKVEEESGQIMTRRGGSDRNFLQLIQDIGQVFDRGNITVYVDSSQGEVKNRQAVRVGYDTDGTTRASQEQLRVLEGPCDKRDLADPLTLNVVFPGGHEQYSALLQRAARARQ